MSNDADLREVIIVEVHQGHEHELYKEQNILDRRMLMYPAYHAALDALSGIIKSTSDWYAKHDEKNKRCKHKDMALYGYANNIIAFCGNRGQGKTSAMLSFTSTLGFRKYGYMAKLWTSENEKELHNYIGNCKFFVLPPIDPTMLREQSNVIGLILTNLLKEIETLWETPKRSKLILDDGKPFEAKKYQILRAFQDCISGLRMEGKETSERKTDFDSFAQSNDVFALKNNIHEIILNLFELLDWEKKESFLVVQLDDTDMHMDRAYETVEFVRKYLCIPNVAVVMATELSQLRSLVNLRYRDKVSYTAGTDVGFDFDYISAKYIDKLIPVPQAIHLPTLKSQRDLGKILKLVIVDDEKKIDESDNHKSAEEGRESGEDEDDIQRRIFKLIYDKTGLVFVRHESYMHEIMPSSLRGYMHLYRLLYRMKEPVKASIPEFEKMDIPLCEKRLERITQKLQNLSQFEDYFLNEWVPSRILEEKNREKVLSLRNVSPGRLSQYIIQHTLSTSKCNPCKDGKKILHIIEDCRSENQPAPLPKVSDRDAKQTIHPGLSYGAYLNALSKYLSTCLTSEQYNFVFAIGTYVSIQLHKSSMIDEIETLQKWIDDNQVGDTIEFKHLRRMIPEAKENTEFAGQYRIKKAITMETEEEKKRGFDKGELAQGCLELLNDKDRIERLDSDSGYNPIGFQIAIVYYCCNWDVLYQIYDNVNQYKKKKNGHIKAFVEEIAEYLKKQKEAVGGRKDTKERFIKLLRDSARVKLPTDKQTIIDDTE